MSGRIVGLNWQAIGVKLDAMQIEGEQRLRVVDLLGGICTGVMRALREAESEE